MRLSREIVVLGLIVNFVYLTKACDLHLCGRLRETAELAFNSHKVIFCSSLRNYLVCLRKLSDYCIHDNHVRQVLSRYSLSCHSTNTDDDDPQISFFENGKKKTAQKTDDLFDDIKEKKSLKNDDKKTGQQISKNKQDDLFDDFGEKLKGKTDDRNNNEKKGNDDKYDDIGDDKNDDKKFSFPLTVGGRRSDKWQQQGGGMTQNQQTGSVLSSRYGHNAYNNIFDSSDESSDTDGADFWDSNEMTNLHRRFHNRHHFSSDETDGSFEEGLQNTHLQNQLHQQVGVMPRNLINKLADDYFDDVFEGADDLFDRDNDMFDDDVMYPHLWQNNYARFQQRNPWNTRGPFNVNRPFNIPNQREMNNLLDIDFDDFDDFYTGNFEDDLFDDFREDMFKYNPARWLKNRQPIFNGNDISEERFLPGNKTVSPFGNLDSSSEEFPEMEDKKKLNSPDFFDDFDLMDDSSDIYKENTRRYSLPNIFEGDDMFSSSSESSQEVNSLQNKQVLLPAKQSPSQLKLNVPSTINKQDVSFQSKFSMPTTNFGKSKEATIGKIKTNTRSKKRSRFDWLDIPTTSNKEFPNGLNFEADKDLPLSQRLGIVIDKNADNSLNPISNSPLMVRSEGFSPEVTRVRLFKKEPINAIPNAVVDQQDWLFKEKTFTSKHSTDGSSSSNVLVPTITILYAVFYSLLF